LGDKELTQMALVVYAAITDTEKPNVDLSYSYIMRQLRKQDKNKQYKFQKEYKETFDKALFEEIENPEELALLAGMAAIDYKDEDA
jgi:hypothetical protein